MGNNIDGSTTEYATNIARNVLDKRIGDPTWELYGPYYSLLTREDILELLEEAVSQVEKDWIDDD